MFRPLSAFIGTRYSSIRGKNHFIAFISLISMIGIALGVTVLIVVLSVMNGFSREIRAEMLTAAPHVIVQNYGQEPLTNWSNLLGQVREHKDIKGAAPYVLEQGMLVNSPQVHGALVRGILPEQSQDVYPLAENVIDGSLEDLKPGEYGVLLGKILASRLQLNVGDKVTLMVPEAKITLAGMIPRMKRFTVVGIFDAGYQYNFSTAFVHLKDAQVLYKLGKGVSGLQLKVDDPLMAPSIAADLNEALAFDYRVADWTRDYGGFFEAIKMEKLVMTLILFLIVIVAVFNLVGSLVTMVADKQSDIAILRTLGASKNTIRNIFMIQGSLIGIIGTLFGSAFGLLLAFNVTEIVNFLQRVFQMQFIAEDVYFIGHVPSDVHLVDIIVIISGALVLSFLATWYPARRAASIQPAEGLRYD